MYSKDLHATALVAELIVSAVDLTIRGARWYGQRYMLWSRPNITAL